MNSAVKNVLFAIAAIMFAALATVLTIYVSIDGYFPVSLRTIVSFEFLLNPTYSVSFIMFWGIIIWGIFFFAIFFSGFRKSLFRLFSPFKELIKFMGVFCREYKKVVIFAIILFFLCFGFEITNPTLSIDDEGAMLGGAGFINVMGDGRLGISIFKSFFQFHPLLPLYLSSFISAALWTVSCLLWCAILFFREDSEKRPDTLPLIIFCGLYMSMPTVIAEFMIFGIYNIEVSFAMALSAISIFCIMRHIQTREQPPGVADAKKDRKYFFAALFPLTFSIATYQSFVPVFITGTIAALICSLLHIPKSADGDGSESGMGNKDFIKWLRAIPLYIFVLVISLAIYYALLEVSLAITNMQPGTYLSTFSGWASGEPFSAIFRNTLIQINIHFFSSGYPGTIGVRLTAVVLGILALLCVISFKGWKRFVMPMMCVLLGISPFLLNLVFMGFMPLRAMQALPLMMGVAWVLLYTVIRRLTLNRVAVVVPCVIAFLLILGQVQTINRLFYGGHMQYQMDRQIATMIMNDVKSEFGGIPEAPIMFLGLYHQTPGPAILPAGLIGRSFWDFDPTDNSRITAFLRAIGYDIVSSDLNKAEMEERYSDLMPIWPESGSIIETENGIMIRLS